jgi:hypothetical protein
MTRFLALLALATLVATAAGCHPDEGERCNPLLFSDECSAADPRLSCVYPPNCGVAYCCPAPSKFSATSSPNCLACPAPDMSMSTSSD